MMLVVLQLDHKTMHKTPLKYFLLTENQHKVYRYIYLIRRFVV